MNAFLHGSIPTPTARHGQHLLSSEARLCHGGDVGRHCRGREEVGALGWPAFAILVGTCSSVLARVITFAWGWRAFDTQFEAWDVREEEGPCRSELQDSKLGLTPKKLNCGHPPNSFLTGDASLAGAEGQNGGGPFFETRRLSLFPAPPLLRTDNWPLWHNRRCISSCSDSAQVWMYSVKMIPTCSNFEFKLWNLGTSTNPLIFPWKFAGLEPQPINWFWGSGPEMASWQGGWEASEVNLFSLHPGPAMVDSSWWRFLWGSTPKRRVKALHSCHSRWILKLYDKVFLHRFSYKLASSMIETCALFWTFCCQERDSLLVPFGKFLGGGCDGTCWSSYVGFIASDKRRENLPQSCRKCSFLKGRSWIMYQMFQRKGDVFPFSNSDCSKED